MHRAEQIDQANLVLKDIASTYSGDVIFVDLDELMTGHMEEVFIEFGLVVACASVMAWLATLCRQPIIIAYVVAGILAGPWGFGWVSRVELIDAISMVGITLLLFLAGLVLQVEADHLVVANIAVDPAAAGQGLGRALMERAEREARRLGLRIMRLTTHIDMPENVRLYEHLGWRETGRSGNKVRMEKSLTS